MREEKQTIPWSIVYGSAGYKNLSAIETLQRKAVRVLTRSAYNAHSDPLFKHCQRHNGPRVLTPYLE